jgi:hypothetical protein
MLYMFEYFIHSAGRSYFPLRPVLDLLSPDEISAFPAGWRVSPYLSRGGLIGYAMRRESNATVAQNMSYCAGGGSHSVARS